MLVEEGQAYYGKKNKFIKLNVCEEMFELMKYPPAFMLMTQISARAKRTDSYNYMNLNKNQAFIGDYRSIGLSEKQYRRAKKVLEKCNFVAFKGANKGTVATILNTVIYDINSQAQGRTEGQTRGGQGATNKKDKNVI